MEWIIYLYVGYCYLRGKIRARIFLKLYKSVAKLDVHIFRYDPTPCKNVESKYQAFLALISPPRQCGPHRVLLPPGGSAAPEN